MIFRCSELRRQPRPADAAEEGGPAGRVVRAWLLLIAAWPVLPGCDQATESRNTSATDLPAAASELSDEQAAELAYSRIQREYEQAVADLKNRIAEASTVDQEYEIFERNNPQPEYINRLMQLGRDYPATQTGLHAVLEAVSRSEGAAKDGPMNYLLQQFADRLNYRKMIQSFQDDVPSQQIERWMQQMIEQASDGEARARAVLGLARYIDRMPAFRKAFESNPHLLAKLPEKQQQYLKSDRRRALQSQLADWLQSVIDENSDAEYEDGKTLTQAAAAELFELQHLSVGCVAPDIIGQDLDGVEFRLSDYRGKIVMLDFWGHWCPPCRRMYPQERALVESLGSKPFVLLGVNSDRSLEVAREAVRDHGLPWRHFWNGPQGTAGPIARQWNIEDWPTVYLIDGDGVIRHKDILGEDLDRALELLLAEAGHRVDLSQLY